MCVCVCVSESVSVCLCVKHPRTWVQGVAPTFDMTCKFSVFSGQNLDTQAQAPTPQAFPCGIHAFYTLQGAGSRLGDASQKS